MSGARGGWIVAASIGAVESLKDQSGICRWNYVLRSIEKRVKNRVSSYYHTQIIPDKASSSGMADRNSEGKREKFERREKYMKKVMDLNAWGPSTIRF